MQEKKVENNPLLASLFPDPRVREIIEDASKREKAKFPGNSTSWHFTNQEGGNKGVEQVGRPCFADLPRVAVTAYRQGLTKLWYRCNCDDLIAVEKRLRWIELGQEVGAVPEGQSLEEIEKEGVAIDLTSPTLSVGELYLTLCYLRWMREAASMVENTLELVDKAGRDFWASVVFCHQTDTHGTGHSVIPFSGVYPAPGYSAYTNRNLGLVLHLHKLCANPEKVDLRRVAEILKVASDKPPPPAREGYPNYIPSEPQAFQWECFDKVIKPPKDLYVSERLMLLADELSPIFNCTSTDEVDTIVKHLKKGNTNVTFQDPAKDPSNK